MIQMMIAALISLGSFSAVAAADSVGVFLRPEKVVVLINERGMDGRLHQFMNQMGAGSELQVLSSDGSLKIECGRKTDAVSCTFRFFPSENTEIGQRFVKSEFAAAELPQALPTSFEMTFESSREDLFVLKAGGGSLSLFAKKRN